MGQAWRGSQGRRKSRLLKLRAQNCPHLMTVCVVGEGGRGVGGLLKGEQKSLESQGEPSPVSDPEDPTVELTEVGTSGPAESLGSPQPPPPLLAAGVREGAGCGGQPGHLPWSLCPHTPIHGPTADRVRSRRGGGGS